MTTSRAQRRLLDAAVDAFAVNGFGGTSTRDIAARAGLSPAGVYVHHESKEGLLYAISAEGHRDSLECLTRSYHSTTDPAQRLWNMVFSFSLWHAENAKVGRVVQYEFHALSDEHRAQILALRRQFHATMVAALSEGIRAASFRVADLDGTARALLSLSIDLVRWFEPAPGHDPDRVARLNADLALRMVGIWPSEPDSDSARLPDSTFGGAPDQVERHAR